MERGNITRIGVSISDSLLKRFDEIIAQRGYSSRSEGIRDAIRNYIADYEWMSAEEGERIGVITILYDHHQRGLSETLTSIQHDFNDIIRVSVHLHLDHHNCLEAILVKGDAKRVKTMAERMMALRGVKQVKLTTTISLEDL
jgi:CopG family nickel-responsive transcriptional regulator